MGIRGHTFFGYGGGGGPYPPAGPFAPTNILESFVFFFFSVVEMVFCVVIVSLFCQAGRLALLG